METNGKKRSGKSALVARHDDNDDNLSIYLSIETQKYTENTFHRSKRKIELKVLYCILVTNEVTY